VREELYEALTSFTDPATGGSPIARIYRKEEILSGPYLDIAPDLLLVPAPFYSLTHARSMIEDADWLSGDHRLEGVIVATGPEVAPGPLAEPAHLIDLGHRRIAMINGRSGRTFSLHRDKGYREALELLREGIEG
jgi:hypothetical protein